MTRDEVLNVGLPKWARLTVLGEPVTPLQAATIILRTTPYPLGDEYVPAARDAHRALGLPPLGGRVRDRAAREAFHDAVNRLYAPLNVDALRHDMIISSWVYGPRGWVGWDGSIRAGTFNIGKWPDPGGIEEEWKRVAEAFPFLSLTAQVWNYDVGSEKKGAPVLEYVVADGHVTLQAPTHLQAVNDDAPFTLDQKLWVDLDFLQDVATQVREYLNPT